MQYIRWYNNGYKRFSCHPIYCGCHCGRTRDTYMQQCAVR